MTTPTPFQLTPGVRVFHCTHRRAATVKAQPRARSEAVQLLMDGNISPQYYSLRELVLGEVAPDAGYVVPPRPVAIEVPPSPPQAPPSAPAPEAAAPIPPPDRLDRAITLSAAKEAPRASGDVHKGDITLDYLLDQRRIIARDLAAFDERIAEVRVLAMLRRALAGLRIDGESDQRVGLSADALKMKHDTARALAAAERLAARGAL